MSEAKPIILIVEDDESIAAGLALNLRLEGYEACVAPDGLMAQEVAAQVRPCLIVLDLALPKKNGLEVLASLRRAGDVTPVVILSARETEADKVTALKLGADDYVTKPFGLAELIARIGAVLRRVSRSDPGALHSERLGVGDVTIDLANRTVTRDGKEIRCTHLEFELLTYLARHPGRVFSREQLLRQVWGVRHEGSTRTVDNFIAQLRAKVEHDPDNPRHLVTVRGSGYRLDT
ncbi:MAG: response regulator transcription factor [Deltaproteobacteria bacterium]|nr:response regulator transcription factor [Deltaproteobacteria bacterium]